MAKRKEENEEGETFQLEVLKVEYQIVLWCGGRIVKLGSYKDPVLASAQFDYEYEQLEGEGYPFDLAIEAVCTTKYKTGGKSQLLVAEEEIVLH